MRSRLWSALAALAALSVAPGVSATDPARAFLMSAFNLSTAEIGRIDGGHVVTRTLEASNRREVATFGVVRISATPSTYVGRLVDIATFKRSDDVLQIGTFSNPSRPGDVAALTIDDADLKGLRDCRVEDCQVRLSAEGIDRVRRDINWQAPDASGKASRLVVQLLVDYVGRYRQDGGAAAMEYADKTPRVHVGREFASLIDA